MSDNNGNSNRIKFTSTTTPKNIYENKNNNKKSIFDQQDILKNKSLI